MDRDTRNLQFILIATLGYAYGIAHQRAWDLRKAFGKDIDFENVSFLDVPKISFSILTNPEYLASAWPLESGLLITGLLFFGTIAWSWHRKPRAQRFP